jgi:hypothetical protein
VEERKSHSTTWGFVKLLSSRSAIWKPGKRGDFHLFFPFKEIKKNIRGRVLRQFHNLLIIGINLYDMYRMTT